MDRDDKREDRLLRGIRKNLNPESLLYKIWEKAKEKVSASFQGELPISEEIIAEQPSFLSLYWKEWMAVPEEMDISTIDAQIHNIFDTCPPDDYAWSEDHILFKEAVETQAEQQLKNTGSISATPVVRLSKDRMLVLLLLLPPLRGGADIDEKDILSLLEHGGISTGVLYSTIRSLVENKTYFSMHTIARGILPGRDGWIIDRIEREHQVYMLEDKYGIVDYKNLNRFRNISQGDIICRIVEPVDSWDGIDVCGKTVPGRPGKAGVVPMGMNTALTEGSTALIAALGGHIVFENGRFNVQNVLVFDGDIDIAVGNIDFYGDVIIHGDVREGFAVKVRGDISVDGMVEDAMVTAGGNITIAKGMNGNTHGVLEAYGDIRCKYLENCIVNCSGNIYADSIICSNVLCNGDVQVTTGKGVIIGGSLTVLGSIRAESIGSKSNRVTDIQLGVSPRILEHKDTLDKELMETAFNLSEVEKDLAYIETQDPNTLGAQREALLDELQKQQPLLSAQLESLSAQISALNEAINGENNATIHSPAIYPRTRIIMGHEQLAIQSVSWNCLIYLDGNNIVLGTYN